MFVWQAHEGAVTSLAFGPGGGLLSTGVDGYLKFWDPLTGGEVQSWKLAEVADNAEDSNLLRVVVDGAGAAVGLRTEGIRYFDLQSFKAVGELRLTGVTALASAPGGEGFFVVGREMRSHPPSRHAARLYQYSFATDKVVAQSRSPVSVGAIAIRPDATEVIVSVTRFRWPDGIRIDHEVLGGSSPQYAVSGDGDKLFGIRGPRLMVWGFQVGTVRQRLKGHIAPITALTTTPDGRTLWTASADASVRQWDIDTYKCEKWYGLKIGPLGCVAVSPDGLTGAAGSSLRGSIALWDLG